LTVLQPNAGSATQSPKDAARPALTIALPAFDEAPNLEHVVEQARNAAISIGDSVEILVVDDGSTDGTGRMADDLAGRYDDVRVVHHATNQGFSGAMRTCLNAARGDWIFLAPADGQIQLDTARAFFEGRGDADIVVGVRQHRSDALHRRFLSWGFHTLTKLAFGLPYTEFSSCFLFRSRFVKGLDLISRPDAATILPEILFRAHRAGAVVTQMTVPHFPRRAGRPKGAHPLVVIRSLVEIARLAVALRLARRRSNTFGT
jgi:glycosyltransferase involved in cell wall biosynthesis